MTTDELIEGVKRILDAATDKFNVLCEESGIEPDDPILTDEEDEESEEMGDGEKVDDEKASDDGNTMPTPSDGAQPPIDTVGDDATAGASMPIPAVGGEQSPADLSALPPDAQQQLSAEQPQLSEEELLAQQQAQQQVQQ